MSEENCHQAAAVTYLEPKKVARACIPPSTASLTFLLLLLLTIISWTTLSTFSLVSTSSASYLAYERKVSSTKLVMPGVKLKLKIKEFSYSLCLLLELYSANECAVSSISVQLVYQMGPGTD